MIKMKRMLAMLLALVLLAGCVPAFSEEAVPAIAEIAELSLETDTAEIPEVPEDAPVSEEKTVIEIAPAAEIFEEAAEA